MTTAKKPTAKKKSIVKKNTSKEAAKLRSFRVAADNPSFTSFKISRQTVYWVIVVSFIIFMQLWIIKLQIEVSSYIDAQESAYHEEGLN